MQLTNVSASVALERMWLYARALTVSEREDLQANLLNGHTVTYTATDLERHTFGQTTLTPEQFPVLTVTETTE